MRKNLAVACGFVICLASSAGAVILHVPSEYPTIHAASLVEVAGDTILVAAGHYDEGNSQLYISPGASVISEEGRELTYITNAGVRFVEAPSSSMSSHLVGFTMSSVSLWLESVVGGVVVADNRLVETSASYIHVAIRASCILANNLIDSRSHYVIDIWNSRPTDMAVALRSNLIIHGTFDFTIYMGGHPSSSGFIDLVMRNNTCIGFTGIDAPEGPPSHMEIVNNIFYSSGGGGATLYCPSYPNQTYYTAFNCIWQTGLVCPDAEEMIYADPLFCDVPGEDYRLQPDSPCIGSGESGTNMGAFPIGCGTTGMPASGVRARYTHLTVRPNPVLHGARFTFTTERAMPMALEIYDPQGRLIEALKPPGPFTWSPASTATSGVYFARLRGDDRSEVVKFVVLR